MRQHGRWMAMLALLPASALAAPGSPEGTAPARPPVPPAAAPTAGVVRPTPQVDPGIKASVPHPKPGTMPVIPPARHARWRYAGAAPLAADQCSFTPGAAREETRPATVRHSTGACPCSADWCIL